MSRWFRFHDEALNDPKVQRLDGEAFKAWVNLLCLASRHGGKLPPLVDIAFALRIDNNAARTVVERLLSGGLIDKASGGADGYTYAPHGWTERQYKSDTSTERVKRFRKRSETVAETPPDTDTDTEIPLDKSNGAVVSFPHDPKRAFWDGAKAYLGPAKSSMIGKWARDYGQPETGKAITEAQLAGAVDPVPYIERVLRRGQSDHDGVPIC